MNVDLNDSPNFQSAVSGFKNIVSVFILREDVDKCLLKKIDGRGWWLPFAALQTHQKSWDTVVSQLLNEIIGTLDDEADKWQLINLTRICNVIEVNVAIFVYKISTVKNDSKLSNTNWRWACVKELSKGHQSVDLIGPEPLTIFNHIKSGHKHLIYDELSFKAVDKSEEVQNSLFQLAKYTEIELQKYFSVFIEKVLPTTVLNETTFRFVMESLGWSPRLVPPLFRAFNCVKSSYVNYSEFLSGLAVMERHMIHGEARCRFVFRFYDSDSDNLMTLADFRGLMNDVNELKQEEIENGTQEKTAEEIYIKLFGVSSTSEGLSIQKFLETIGSLKFRGTSTLLRLKKPFNHFLKLSNFTDRNETPPAKRAKMSDGTLKNWEASTSTSGCESNNRSKSYKLATHTVKLKYSGQLLDIQAIWDLEGTPAVNSDIRFDELAKISRLDSVDYFNKMSPQSRILIALKKWTKKSPNMAEMNEWNGWDCLSPTDIAQCLLTVCQEATSIMKNESRMLKLTSPVYIFGDLHGSYKDLVYFEKAFWRFGTSLTPAKLLFLGDYVDRGDFGLEVVAHLLSHKVLTPNNVLLLRGNHEVRNIQKDHTFYRECLFKLGNQLGEQVWETINQCFDTMPLAAVVDQQVFCVHGGIFSPQYGNGFIDVIQRIPVPLSDPHTCPVAWELIWNDPTDESHPLTDTTDEGSNQGFYSNLKRKTAKCFSSSALESFLSRNKLSHVIRAHQVKQAGFQLQQHGKLVTVYSSSTFLGRSNEIACVLADNSKLRILIIDTKT
ncbi:hypothetical protein CHUAL_005921 [Chamberlinius hualienensis]